jgi:hypothetical protein
MPGQIRSGASSAVLKGVGRSRNACRPMLRCVVLRHAVPCRVMPCHAIPGCAVSNGDGSWDSRGRVTLLGAQCNMQCEAAGWIWLEEGSVASRRVAPCRALPRPALLSPALPCLALPSPGPVRFGAVCRCIPSPIVCCGEMGSISRDKAAWNGVVPYRLPGRAVYISWCRHRGRIAAARDKGTFSEDRSPSVRAPGRIGSSQMIFPWQDD